MKILISGLNTAGLIHDLSDGFKKLEHEVHTASYTTNLFYAHDFSLHISQQTFVEKITKTEVVPSDIFYTFAEQFDLFIFNTGLTLLPGMCDLPLLRQMGKKIIVRNTGSCTRFLYPGSLLWNHAGALFNISCEELHELARPACDWQEQSSYFGDIIYAYHLAPKLYKECMCALYADVVTNCPAHSSLSFAPFFAATNTFDSKGLVAKIPARSKPIILHAPSREAFKGTNSIIACLEELQAEGLPFELVRVDKLPNQQLRLLLQRADIVIDDLACGWHGTLANESMASGCLVLGTNFPEVSPIPFHRPVIPITRSNLKEQIRRAVLDLPFRRRVAEAGIEYVHSVHSPETLASYLLSCLDRSARNAFDYYPTLFLDNPFRPDYADWIDKTDAQLYAPDGDCSFNDRRDEVPLFLRQLFDKALFKTGAHPQTDMEAFLRHHYLEKLQEKFLHRWDITHMTSVNPWLWLGETAGQGLPCREYLSYDELIIP